MFCLLVEILRLTGGFEKPGFLVKIETGGIINEDFLKFRQRKYWAKRPFCKAS